MVNACAILNILKMLTDIKKSEGKEYAGKKTACHF